MWSSKVTMSPGKKEWENIPILIKDDSVLACTDQV